MATYLNATNINPIDVGEMKAGEYVLSEDLNRMIESTHALLYNKSNIVAYSYCHTSPVQGSVVGLENNPADENPRDVFYVFTIRRPIPGKHLTMHIWGQYADLYLEMQDAITSAWTEVGDATLGALGRTFITYASTTDSDVDGSDNLHRIRFRLVATGNQEGQLGIVYGFVMTESNLDTDDTSAVGGTTTKSVGYIPGLDLFTNIDTTAAADNSPFDVLKFRLLMRNIDILARTQSRGCAVVFPRHFRYALSSAFWRADGPFQWKASPWCSKVTVIVDGDSVGDIGWNGAVTGVGAFSSALKEDVRDTASLQALIFQGNKLTSNSNSFVNCVAEITDVKVRAGENNEIFLAYRGQFYDATATFDDQRLCAWEEFNEGTMTLRYKTSSEDPDPDYVLLYAHPVGIHFVFRAYDSTSVTGYVPDPGSPTHSTPGSGGDGGDVESVPVSQYSPLPGEEEFPDTYSVWDLANFRSTDGDRNISISVSPSPPFTVPTDQNARYHAQMCKHGFAYLNSVWINEQYDGLGDLYQFADHRRPPQAALNFVHLKLLNNMLDHPWQVNGLRHVCASHGRMLSGSMQDRLKASNGRQYFMLRNLQEKLKDITNPIYQTIAQFPVTIPLDNTQPVGDAPRRIYDKVRFRVHYRIFKMNDGNDGSEVPESEEGPKDIDDNNAAKVRLFVRAMFADSPGGPLPGSGSSLINPSSTYSTDPLEINITNKPQSRLTVQTFTEWDAMVSASKGGYTKTGGGDGAHFMSTNQHGWPSEIIGEKYPWDIFEFEADLNPLIYGELDGGSIDGPRPEFDFPTWAHLQAFFYSYKESGTGVRTAVMNGGDKYHMVISSISCVPSNYPLEDTVEEV